MKRPIVTIAEFHANKCVNFGAWTSEAVDGVDSKWQFSVVFVVGHRATLYTLFCGICTEVVSLFSDTLNVPEDCCEVFGCAFAR
jgi:hypothetical protein